jgi:hypothetical protein
MINLDHVHFQHKTVIYFVQTFGNIYTIVPFCKHALRVFHAIAWLILLAHAQTNFPPVTVNGYRTSASHVQVHDVTSVKLQNTIILCCLYK